MIKKTSLEDMLFEELKEANQVLRSAYSISKREGKECNWDAFNKTVSALLEKHHAIIYEQHTPSAECWCNPIVDYVDPITGSEVYIHNNIQEIH